MNILDVSVFLSAVAMGSLSGAARLHKIAPMVATRRLASLEAELGVKLLYRTTRSLSVTAEGEAFLPFAKRIVQEAEAGKATVKPTHGKAYGRLRITSCATIGRTIVMPVVSRLLVENPDLEIDLVVTDELVDVVSAGVDVAVRIGDLKDSNLTGKVIGRNPRSLYAAPGYLSSRNHPRRIEDLADHECLLLSGSRHWTFSTSRKDIQVPASGRFTSTTIEGLYDACLHSSGIAVLSEWRAEADVSLGRLVPITLQDGQPKAHAIHAVFPSRQKILPKARLFVDAMKSALRERLGESKLMQNRSEG